MIMAAYLTPKPDAQPVMLLLADALSPKGEWCGPYVINIFGTGYVQQPGSAGYHAFYNPMAPHARKLLDKRPA
jgi:hypothetical protein